MTQKTRYFMIGSAAILVVGLCTGLVAYYGGLGASPFRQAGGPAELAYVPADAALVAYANVHDVMTSELRRRLQDVMPPDEDKGREEFKSHTGIDLETDIDYVVASMTPKAGQDGRGESGFVVFRGRFDEVRLEGLAREHGATVEDYRGKRLIRVVKAAEGAPEGREARVPVLTFVEPGLAMFGDEAAVRHAIDTRASGQSVLDNTEVMALVSDVERGSNAWAVGRFDVLASQANLPEGMSSRIPPIKWFAVTGHVNGGVAGTFRAEANDEEAARNLRDVINGFMALARLQAGSKPELQGMLQAFTLGGSGRTVELSFALPSEVIDALSALSKNPRQTK
jgi:hypothetical protein